MTSEKKPRKLTMLRARGYDYRERIPSVTLAGRWLKDFGFLPGDKICIERLDDGKLILVKVAAAQ